jgi:hypothetical protein
MGCAFEMCSPPELLSLYLVHGAGLHLGMRTIDFIS